MPVFTDAIGHTLTLYGSPQRIVSLVPSQTELLYHLGLEEEVAGITKFCIHPQQWFKTKTRVGGTKKINLDAVRKLNPDLIIANKEENVKEQVEALQQVFPVYTTDIATLSNALEMIIAVGALVGKEKEAIQLKERIENDFATLTFTETLIPACYLIWKDPYITIGGDTFISALLPYAGFRNVFSEKARYPAVTIDDIKQSGCTFVLLSSEPYPFTDKHLAELKVQLPGVAVLLVDGELFSWYGSRLQFSPSYFKQLRLAAATTMGF